MFALFFIQCTALVQLLTEEISNKAIRMNKKIQDKDGNILVIVPSKFELIATINATSDISQSSIDILNHSNNDKVNPYLMDTTTEEQKSRSSVSKLGLQSEETKKK